MDKLTDLPIVGDVRGEGYFYGIELVKDKATKETFNDDESERLLRGFLSRAIFDAGLYCRADDRGDPVVQLAPPLICEQSHFDDIEQILRSVLTEAWTLVESGLSDRCARRAVATCVMNHDPGRPAVSRAVNPRGPDDIDKALVTALQRNGRESYAPLAKIVGLSEAAVRQRVQRLLDDGVVQIVGVTDPMVMGFPALGDDRHRRRGRRADRRRSAGRRWTRSTTWCCAPARSTSSSRWSARTTTGCSPC